MSTKVNHWSWLLFGSLFAILGACHRTHGQSSVISVRESVPPPQVPNNIGVPDGQTVLLKALGKGVQIYNCKARADDPSKFEWSFKAPEADLTNEYGDKIGKHYAGPTWEANDGSKVVGEVKARDDGPNANAIPWLLLSAKSTSGKGVFSEAQSIQRLYTVGGKASAQACNQAQLGKEARVPYKATYYFYVAKP